MPLSWPTFFTSKHRHIGCYEDVTPEFGGHRIQFVALRKIDSRDSADDGGAHVTSGRPARYSHLLRTWSLGAFLCLLFLLLTALSQCNCCVRLYSVTWTWKLVGMYSGSCRCTMLLCDPSYNFNYFYCAVRDEKACYREATANFFFFCFALT